MRIAINGTILDKKPSGLGIYTLNVIKELSKIPWLKKELVLFTPCPDEFASSGLRVVRVPRYVQPHYGKKAGLFRFFWNQTILPLLLIINRCDLLYNTTHHGSFFFKKQIITVCDLLALRYPSQHRLQYYYFKLFLPIILKRSIKIITISENTKEDIALFYGIAREKIEVIHIGFSTTNEKKYDIKKKYKLNKYILCVGATYPHKNCENLIKSFFIIKNKLDISLVIVGGKEKYIKLLKKLVEELQLNDRVLIVSYVSSLELANFYCEAEAFVYPSFYEGFGMPPLEAMYHRCPCIVSKTSSIPEVCGDAVYYFDPNDVNGIANGIESVLADETLRNKLIQRGLERVKLFSWEKTGNKTVNLLRGCRE